MRVGRTRNFEMNRRNQSIERSSGLHFVESNFLQRRTLLNVVELIWLLIFCSSSSSSSSSNNNNEVVPLLSGDRRISWWKENNVPKQRRETTPEIPAKNKKYDQQMQHRRKTNSITRDDSSSPCSAFLVSNELVFYTTTTTTTTTRWQGYKTIIQVTPENSERSMEWQGYNSSQSWPNDRKIKTTVTSFVIFQRLPNSANSFEICWLTFVGVDSFTIIVLSLSRIVRTINERKPTFPSTSSFFLFSIVSPSHHHR